MTGEDLFKEEQCAQCGRNKLKNASFCPHCGHVKRQSWFDGLMDSFSGSKRGAVAGAKGGIGISTLIGLAFAGYLLYSAIDDGSVQSMIIAALILFTVFHSWYTGRKQSKNGTEGSSEGPNEVKEGDQGPMEDKFFCENCRTRVAADASECPKCGMKFG